MGNFHVLILAYCSSQRAVFCGSYSFRSNELHTISLAWVSVFICPVAFACIRILPLAVASIGPVITFLPKALALNCQSSSVCILWKVEIAAHPRLRLVPLGPESCLLGS